MRTRPTPELLMATAERLYAERGIGAVSLRQIAEASGQRNQAAVQYHFGSKLDLLRAIVASRVKPFDERRLALLEILDTTQRSHDVKGLVEASVLPLVELEPPQYYVRFLARLTLEEPGSEVFEDAGTFGAGYQLVVQRLHEALRTLPTPLRVHRIVTARNTLLQVLAHHQQRLKADPPDLLPFDLVVDDLVTSVACLLLAPAPANAAARLRRSALRLS